MSLNDDVDVTTDTRVTSRSKSPSGRKTGATKKGTSTKRAAAGKGAAGTRRAAPRKGVATKATGTHKTAAKKTSGAVDSTGKVTASSGSRAPAGAVSTSISPEERYQMISVRAYLRSETRGFIPGYEVHDWLESEAEVDGLLSK